VAQVAQGINNEAKGAMTRDENDESPSLEVPTDEEEEGTPEVLGTADDG
jgi:hypothetical protein